jgi:glutamate--cysteine ligase
MTMTATVQASFDYSDEADMIAKVQMASRVSSLVTALFANSPIREGRKTGALSFRTLVWREVDPKRCGIRPEFFAPDFGYAGYANWALDIPMIFVRREHRYLDPRGLSFRRFLAEGLDGERATPSDWEDHLTTLFPEVRLKRVVEMRGADMGTAEMCLALPSLWKGLLYDGAALQAAAALVPLTVAELLELQESVAREGLRARAGRRTVAELCRELVELATQGLRGQERCGPDEGGFLHPLREILDRGLTPAEEALIRFEGEFKGDPKKLLEHWRVA